MDDLEKVQSILKKLNGNVLNAIALNELHSSSAFEARVSDRFDNTIEAYAFNQITWSLFFELVMTLMRIYDPGKSDAASLHALFKLLNRSGILEKISEEIKREESERVFHSIWPAHPEIDVRPQRQKIIEGRIIARLKAIDEAKAAYKLIQSNEYEKRLRGYRDKAFAHSATQYEPMLKAQFGDADELLALTKPVIEKLTLALRNESQNYSGFKRVWRGRAETFWQNCHPKTKNLPKEFWD